MRGLGIPFDLVEEDTYSIVVEKTAPTKSYCGLCSRLRRGILYTHTQQNGAQRLALGHHRDDALETLLLNMVHQGTMKAMPARYVASRGVDVIRPLMYCAEDDLREYATRLEFPILPCNLCGSQPAGKPSQRQGAKQLLHFLDAFGGDGEDVRENMLRALSDVRPSHLLDRDLRGACGLDPCTGEPVDDRASRIFRAPGGDDDDELAYTALLSRIKTLVGNPHRRRGERQSLPARELDAAAAQLERRQERRVAARLLRRGDDARHREALDGHCAHDEAAARIDEVREGGGHERFELLLRRRDLSRTPVHRAIVVLVLAGQDALLGGGEIQETSWPPRLAGKSVIEEKVR